MNGRNPLVQSHLPILSAVCLSVGILLSSGSAKAAVAGVDQTGEVAKVGHVQVTLKLPRSQTIARAVQLTRLLDSTGDVDEVKYQACDCEEESAEIVHSESTPKNRIQRVVAALREAMLQDIEVGICECSESDQRHRVAS